MTETERPFSVAFIRIAELAEVLGATPMCEHEGCWEHRVDERWEVVVNGHRDARDSSAGTKIPPFSALVRFNGWPAAVLNPYGGEFVVGCFDEDAFIRAVEGAIEKEGGTCSR